MYSPRAYERELYYSELVRLIDQNQVASVRMIGDPNQRRPQGRDSLCFDSAYGQNV